MNILYLNNEMTVGGVAKCILKLCKELRKNNKIFIASKDGGALLSEFENIGINNYPILDVENKLPHNVILNLIKIIKIIKKEKIDIIHSHHRMTTMLAKIASKFIKVKVIHTQHLCIEDKFKLTRLALKNIDVITVSNEAKRILVEKSKLDGQKIKTIYNTVEVKVNLEEIDERLVELKKEGYFIVSQISRVVDYKGVYDFVKVAKETIKINNNIKFVFIGDGPEREKLQLCIDNEGLSQHILLLGSKNNVIEHLRYIDLFILCSYIEGLPLTPIEAFSQSIPVIGTNIGGTNEEIVDGVNGYLVSTKDIDGFKEKILYLYNNRELLRNMGKKAYNTYVNEFNETRYVEEHRKIYIK